MSKLVLTMDSAKERFTQARKAACSADRLSSALYDRLAAETLLAIKGQPAERAATMLIRMAVCLEVLAEYRGWPERVADLPDRAPRSRRAEAEAVFDDA